MLTGRYGHEGWLSTWDKEYEHGVDWEESGEGGKVAYSQRDPSRDITYVRDAGRPRKHTASLMTGALGSLLLGAPHQCKDLSPTAKGDEQVCTSQPPITLHLGQGTTQLTIHHSCPIMAS